MNKIKDQLNEKSCLWQNMDRATNEQRQAAEDYYKTELMPDTIELFLEENGRKEECDSMILTLGTSYEPLVLSILAIKPKRVLILYTDKSFQFLDDVIEFTKLKPSQYITWDVSAENPLQLYQIIKETYEKWGKPKDIYVDFTGGTKSMAAGCAMAGSIIGAKLLYVGGEFLKDLRKPKPGSEKLYYVDNPYVIFGDIERDQAISLFNKMDYVSAARIFEDLEQKVPGTKAKEYEALKLISKAYNMWDCLNIREAESNLSKCHEIILNEGKLVSNFILSNKKEKIELQLEFLGILGEIHCSEGANTDFIFINVGYLIANLYQNAIRREQQGKFEMASLLLYRILEIVEQKRLWNYGVNTGKPDYSRLRNDIGLLLNDVNKTRVKIKDFDEVNQLDEKIGLISGYILLAAIGDEIIKPGKAINALNELRSKVDARNKSIFAHGYEFIDEKKYTEFKKVVENYIDLLFAIEKINKAELFSSCEFLEL